MRLHHRYFEAIKGGTKTIEVRLYDEKRRLIKENDIIEFESRTTGEKIDTKVVRLHKFNNFKELYSNFDKVILGYYIDEEAKPEDMEQFYSKVEQEEFGVVGIEIELI